MISEYETDYIEQLYNRLEVEEEENYFNNLVDEDDDDSYKESYEYQLMQELEEEECNRSLLKAYNIDSY